MSRETYAKMHASQVIEDLLADSRNDNSQQNWLLSYLDVFILIIMLVITLLAITDFATPSDEKQTNKKIAKKQIKSVKKKSETKSITKNPQLKRVSQPNKKQEIEAISSHKPKSVSLKIIAKKIVTSKQKKSEIKITQETTKTTQPKATPLDNTKSEIKEPLAEKTVLAKQESKVVDKLDITKSNPQTIKQPIQESNSPANAWQNQLKKQLGQLESVNVKIKEGYAEIEIQDNILYESAQASLTEEGKALLKKMTDLLKQSTGIIFIEGHTDNQPIATKQFPSNWELGSARATSVLHFLASQDLNSQRLRAVTYADTMPLSDNSTEEGRKKNRRVNLLVKIPEL